MTRWTSTLTVGGCKKTIQHGTRKCKTSAKDASPAQNSSKVWVPEALQHTYIPPRTTQTKLPKDIMQRGFSLAGRERAHGLRAVIGRYEFSPRGLNVWFGHSVGERVGWIFFLSFCFVWVLECLDPGLRSSSSPFYTVDALTIALKRWILLQVVHNASKWLE